MTDARERLIVALDVSSASAAQKIVTALGESVHTYKVGTRLYTAEGPQIVRDLVHSGRNVFLDLNYHDIPNTVGPAVRGATQLKVSMLTVHASGGGRMLRAAVEAAKNDPQLMVLAVTVLTSLDDADLEKMGVRGRAVVQVMRLATLALANRCKGIVASALEAAELRSELGTNFAIVTPGVRSSGTCYGGQVRVVTPSEAMSAGATHIVVGRLITDA